jgi:hypothetical protein
MASREATEMGEDRMEKGNTESLPESQEECVKSEEGKEGKEVVTLDAEDDPKNRTKLRRWFMTAIICVSSICVTFDSSVVSTLPPPIARSSPLWMPIL